jgi:Flp pilus assembly protein TadG
MATGQRGRRHGHRPGWPGPARLRAAQPRAGRLRWARLRRGLLRNDSGASSVELVILAPALIFVSMLVVQFALWLNATHAAQSAAQEGDRVARETEFTNSASWQQTATQVALNYYHGLNTSVLGGVSVSRVSFDAAADTVAVTVSGRLNGIFPLPVSETVSGPVECFRTSASEGAKCG